MLRLSRGQLCSTLREFFQPPLADISGYGRDVERPCPNLVFFTGPRYSVKAVARRDDGLIHLHIVLIWHRTYTVRSARLGTHRGFNEASVKRDNAGVLRRYRSYRVMPGWMTQSYSAHFESNYRPTIGLKNSSRNGQALPQVFPTSTGYAVLVSQCCILNYRITSAFRLLSVRGSSCTFVCDPIRRPILQRYA
jgi:hypothetical protein